MRSKTPVYVAGFERGVRPIGPWSTCTTLSSSSVPVTRVCLPGTRRAPLRREASTSYRMSLTSEDLPEPLTPVTDVSTPSGKSTVTLRRLLARAPTTVILRLLSMRRRFFGVGISRRPVR